MPIDSAAARAEAIDTARSALAPSFDLFGVPSSSSIAVSVSNWSVASQPRRVGAIVSSIFREACAPVQSLGLNRVNDMHVDSPSSDPQRPRRHHFPHTADHRLNDQPQPRYRKHERTLLQRPEMIVAAADALGIYDDRTAARHV